MRANGVRVDLAQADIAKKQLSAKEKELMAYEHDGFWQPMDTLRDKELLEKLWQDNQAPWKKW